MVTLLMTSMTSNHNSGLNYGRMLRTTCVQNFPMIFPIHPVNKYVLKREVLSWKDTQLLETLSLLPMNWDFICPPELILHLPQIHLKNSCRNRNLKNKIHFQLKELQLLLQKRLSIRNVKTYIAMSFENVNLNTSILPHQTLQSFFELFLNFAYVETSLLLQPLEITEWEHHEISNFKGLKNAVQAITPRNKTCHFLTEMFKMHR